MEEAVCLREQDWHMIENGTLWERALEVLYNIIMFKHTDIGMSNEVWNSEILESQVKTICEEQVGICLHSQQVTKKKTDGSLKWICRWSRVTMEWRPQARLGGLGLQPGHWTQAAYEENARMAGYVYCAQYGGGELSYDLLFTGGTVIAWCFLSPTTVLKESGRRYLHGLHA